MAALSPERTVSAEWAPLTPIEQENARLIQEMIELRGIFDREMKGYSPGKRHSRVVVLLLYWDKVSGSHLDTKEEIDQLEEMFHKNFRYTVYKKSLNAAPEKAAKVLLQKYIADVVWEVDEPNSLLIVYYAGHGNPGPNGDIILTGGNYHPGSKVDTIIWGEAERLVRNAEKTDVFLIFDCCYAGRISAPDTRQAFSPRNFEFLAASVGLTQGPGEHSFTSALLYALETLSGDADGFTTHKLFSTVRRAPNFPKGQTPVWEEPGAYSSRKLLLAPLPDTSIDTSSVPRIDTEKEKHNAKFGLCLQLTFDNLPAANEMEKMCQGLKSMLHNKELNAKQINWKGMHRSNESMYDIPASAYFAANKWVNVTRRATRSSVGSKAMMNTGRSRRLSEAASPPSETAGFPGLTTCESPDMLRETLNTHSMEEVGEAAGEAVLEHLEKHKLVVPRSAYDYRPYLMQRRLQSFPAGLLIGLLAGCSVGLLCHPRSAFAIF